MKNIALAVIVGVMLGVAMPLMAQERAAVSKPQTTQARSVTVQRMQLSDDSRVDALRSAIEQCGRSCRMGGPTSVAVPGGGGTLDYNCDENGNCACFGAKDCVAMTDICDKDTLGCNEQGCICEKGD